MEAKTMNSREYLRRTLDRELNYLTISSFNVQRAVGQLNEVMDNCPYEAKRFECKYLRRTTERELQLLEMSFNEINAAINILKEELVEYETTPFNPDLVREESPEGEEGSTVHNEDEKEECGTQTEGENETTEECRKPNHDANVEFVEATLWSTEVVEAPFKETEA